MTEARPQKPFAFICLVLALGTAALYWPITSHPFIIYDDGQYIIANPHVTTGLSRANFAWAFTSGEAANWHPLTWLSHQLDCSLFGLNAGGHHLVNLLFHVANTLLVLVFLRDATGAFWRSALVAALFAWHPMHVESVAWAAERKDVLSTFFWLLTLIAYVGYARNRNWWRYLLTLGLFSLGLMSKPMVVTLPCVLLLLDFWPLQRVTDFSGALAGLKSLKALLLEKIPFFVLAAAGCVVTYLVQTGAGAEWATPLPERLANAFIAYALYVIKIFRPTDLAIVYSLPKHWPVLLALVSALLLGFWTILILKNWRRCPFLAVGWLWFLGTLVPTIGVIQVGAQAMADRYSYIPSIGLFIALVWGCGELVTARPHWKNISVLLAGGALLACMLLTARQITYWRDSVSLFLHAIEVSPDNYVAENSLGKAFERNGGKGDELRALVLYQNTVKLEPRYSPGQLNCAMSLFAFGQMAEGFEHLQAAARIEPHNPDIQFDLGVYYSQTGGWTNAAVCFGNYLKAVPWYAPAQRNYGNALANLGRYAEAVPHYREALRQQPDLAGAQAELDRILSAHPELR
jgi:hypothetical protein